jgi:hypothetical protein
MPSFVRPYESVAVRECSKTLVGHLVTRSIQKDGHYRSTRVAVLLLSIALLFSFVKNIYRERYTTDCSYPLIYAEPQN